MSVAKAGYLLLQVFMSASQTGQCCYSRYAGERGQGEDWEAILGDRAATYLLHICLISYYTGMQDWL